MLSTKNMSPEKSFVIAIFCFLIAFGTAGTEVQTPMIIVGGLNLLLSAILSLKKS